MVASVLAHTHCNHDGSQRAGFCHMDNGSQRAGLPTSTMMVASVLAQTHFNFDGSQRAWLCHLDHGSVLAYPLQL